MNVLKRDYVQEALDRDLSSGRRKGRIAIDTRNSQPFMDISYLKTGNAKQREAFAALDRLGIFRTLAAFSPVLAGTVPIDIDVEDSDLDIICEMREPEALEQVLIPAYGALERFALSRERMHGDRVIVCNFRFGPWPVEIFAQNLLR